MGCQRPLGKADYTEKGGERISEDQNSIKGVQRFYVSGWGEVIDGRAK